MFCNNCGAELKNGEKFCPNCGASVIMDGRSINAVTDNAGIPEDRRMMDAGFDVARNQEMEEYRDRCFKKLISMERIGMIIWIIIAVIQILTVFGCVAGGWNLYACYRTKKHIDYIKKNRPAGLYDYYKSQKSSLIIMFLINLFLGAVIGIIGVIYDFIIRHYVISHKDAFM